MGMKKDYDPNEIDTIQQGYDMKDENEKKEARYRKDANIKKRRDEDEERNEVEKEIIKRYGSKRVKEDYFRDKEIKKIYASSCYVCHQYKIYPYDFITSKGNINEKGKCTSCMAKITKRVSEYKIKCVCNVMYDDTDLGLSKHECSRTHINALKQLKATGLNVVYKMPSLIKICEANDIKYYTKGKVDDIFIKLKALDKIVIPEGLPEDME